jgi:hypothetical protein
MMSILVPIPFLFTLGAYAKRAPSRETRRLNTAFCRLYFYGHGVQQDFAEAHHWAQKAAEGVFGILFIGLNILLIAIYYTKHLFLIRSFCSFNGMFIGVSISLAIFLWRRNNKAQEEQNGNCENAAPETTAE